MRTALLALLFAGCTINSDRHARPRDLTPSTLVDRMRIMAVIAEPPEVRPGERVTFEALVTDPNDESPVIVWLACPPDQAGGYGCAVDLASVGAAATPEELAALGVIGFEPGFAPSYVADASLLDGLDAGARKEGVSVTVQVAAFPEALLVSDPDAIDYDAVEVAYKRLVVSEATTPNHNPAIAAFTIDGLVVPAGAVAELDAGQPYELGIVLADDAVETYEYENSEGIVEERVEEPYADWTCTVDGIQEGVTIHPFLQSDFHAPVEPGDATCWAVVRDRRGGMAFVEQAFTIR